MDDEFVSEIEARRYCHTCGQPYTGKECGNAGLHRRIERFRNAPRVSASAEDWAADHAGPCNLCGKPGRLYPAGYRCAAHPTPGSVAA